MTTEDFSGTTSSLGMALEHFGRGTFLDGGKIIDHTHSHYEFCLLESGAAIYQVEEEAMRMAPGDLCITRPGEYHGMTGVKGEGPWSLLFINVRQMPEGELVDTFAGARSKVLTGCAHLQPMFEDVLAEARGRGFASTIAVHANTARLLVAIARRIKAAQPETPALPYSRPVILAIDYIGKFGRYSSTVWEIAHSAGVSESHLSHIFKKETGTTVREYLRSTLMDRSKRMLEEGKYTVTEMAERLGFPGIACFSAFFRARQGLSPTSYRRSNRD